MRREGSQAKIELPAKPDFFIIFSLSRCGSTTICRVLHYHSYLSCLNEPPFVLTNCTEKELHDRAEVLRGQGSGMKHVWDPSGYPFRSDHNPRVGDMNQHARRWVELNEALLGRGGQKIIFLRRNNQLQRTVSDLLGQQTDIWGPSFDAPAHVDEGTNYRSRIRAAKIGAINTDVLEWYMTHIPEMEKRLRRAAGKNPCLDLYYEDIFGNDVSIAERLSIYSRILNFLGYPTEASNYDASSVMTLLRPAGKLNTSDTYSKITNLRQIEEMFGSLSSSATA
jgi:hypothetical protein